MTQLAFDLDALMPKIEASPARRYGFESQAFWKPWHVLEHGHRIRLLVSEGEVRSTCVCGWLGPWATSADERKVEEAYIAHVWPTCTDGGNVHRLGDVGRCARCGRVLLLTIAAQPDSPRRNDERAG